MISGATRGSGGAALGNHLANAEANEAVHAGPSRGLTAMDPAEQVAELTRMGSHARTQQPLYHIHADPPAGRPFTDEERLDYWDRMEQELGLQGRPFSSTIHVKHGREHEHRVYLRCRADGRAIRLDHDYARREKVARITEYERGEPLTRGAHNRAVIAALEGERPEVAEAMRAAGLHEGPRPRAGITPTERMQQERTGISKGDTAAAVSLAWQQSDSGPAFAAALAERGLRLARGDKSAVVLDASGNAHAVTRMLAMNAKATGTEASKAAAVRDRLDGMDMPSVAEALQQPVQVPQPDPPAPGPGMPPDDGGAAHPPAAKPDAYIHTNQQSDAILADPVGTPGGGKAASVSSPAAPALMGHANSAPVPMVSQAAPGAMLEDAGPGPGEPPGPGAHPDEFARYRAALHAHAERKHKVLQAFMRAMAAASEAGHQATNIGGGHHETVQQMDGWQRWWPEAVRTAVAAGYTAEEARRAVRAAGLDRQSGSPSGHGAGTKPGHDHAGGGEGEGHLRPGEGSEGAQPGGRESVAADDGAWPGGERDPGRHQGAAGGHRGAADSPGRQAFQDRGAVHRATRSLATLNLSVLRDRLDPARVAVRESGRIRADIDSRQATAPGQPGAAWERERGMDGRTITALDRLMERVHAGDPMTLSAIREQGFPEVLREEGLRVIMDQDATSHPRCAYQAVRAGLDGGQRAAGRWTPPTR